VQGYLLALPVVNQVANRDAILAFGPANTSVPIWENLVDSRTVGLTFNDNTPYTWMWVDLHGGPLVIEVPPKVLGLVDDIWYKWNGDIGITGPDKGKAENTSCCRPAMRAKFQKAISSFDPVHIGLGRFGAASSSTATPSPALISSKRA